MQVRRRVLVVLALALVGALTVPGLASAQYAPGGGIECDTSTVLAGEAFRCAADGFRAGSDVSVTASGSTTGASRTTTAAGQWTFETTVRARSGGVATAVIQTPSNATGPASVTFVGVDPGGDTRVLSNATAVTVTQPAAGDGPVAPAPAVPDDGAAPDGADGAAAPDQAADDDLPATGTDVARGIVLVVALLLVGGVLVLSVRRRGRARTGA